jgi:D-alanyl-D-alanine-carboxypeptidase/D-alanyl-D-alanine-endopeptidase
MHHIFTADEIALIPEAKTRFAQGHEDRKWTALRAGDGSVFTSVYATARDEFFYKVVDAQLSCIRAADGKVKEVVLHQNGRDMRGVKLAAFEGVALVGAIGLEPMTPTV